MYHTSFPLYLFFVKVIFKNLERVNDNISVNIMNFVELWTDHIIR